MDKIIHLIRDLPCLKDIGEAMITARSSFYTESDAEIWEMRRIYREVYDCLLENKKYIVDLCSSAEERLSSVKDIRYSKSPPENSRGYYCSLPYVKKRGKLVSKPSRSGYYFKYYFENENLLCVEKYEKEKLWGREFIFYCDDCTLGFSRLESSEVIFPDLLFDEYRSGKTVRHIWLSQSRFEIEEYEYTEGDVLIMRTYFDVLRHMGKRYMLIANKSSGSKYDM